MGKKVKIAKVIVFFIVTICLLSCNHILLPSGKYISNKTEDFIIIDKEKISFYIKYDNRSRERTGGHTYEYTVLPDRNGEIDFTVTSIEAVYGLGKFNFYWDGKFIKMLNSEGKELNNFSMHYDK